MHLTNYTINKKAENYEKNKDANVDGVGSKWSFKALRKKYTEMGIDFDQVW